MRFFVVFAALLSVFYCVYLPTSQSRPYAKYLEVLAEVCGAVLRTLAQDASVSEASIISPLFTVEIVPGCDGLEALALFGCAVLASPVVWRRRIVFLLSGAIVLMTVNVIRLVSLFYIGVYFPNALDRVHWDLWPGFLIVAIFACWFIWARWAQHHGGTCGDTAG